jgi:hypothetical protein
VELTQSCDFTIYTTAGQSISTVVGDLATLVNDSPLYEASVDANTPLTLEVKRMGGVEATHLQICSTDPNIDIVGITFAEGKKTAVINQVTSVAGHVTGYTLQIDASIGSDINHTFNTTLVPDNTPAGLNASICSFATGLGYTCQQIFSSIVIAKPGAQILAATVTANDPAISNLCVDVTDNPPSVGTIPTLSQYGMFVLVLLMTGAAIIVMRRKAALSH